MSCQAIISDPPAILEKSTTVAEALAILREKGVNALPVTDAKGHFLGVFGLRELIVLLLPRAVRLGVEMGELGFVSDTLDDLRHRLGAFAKDSIGKHMAPHRAVRAETPLVEALMLLYRGDSYLPVVDSAGKLIGIVTANDAMTRVVEGI